MSDNDASLRLGPGVVVILVFYVMSLVAVALYSYKQRVGLTMDDHVLAGRSLPTAILVLSMFSTIFSGYTVVGVPSDAFSTGFRALRWVVAPIVLTASSALIMPQLHSMSRTLRFVSPTDFIAHRFGSQPLRLLCTAVMLVPAAIQGLAQFRAMGAATEGFSGGDVHRTVGASAFAAIMLTCEYLGGMRSVAYSDAIQSAIMIVTFAALMALLGSGVDRFSSLQDAFRAVPERFFSVPPAAQQASFVSFCLLFLALPLYPHVLQRAYAARSARQLKIVSFVMGWAPLFANFATFCLGIVALGVYGADPRIKPDSVFARIGQRIMRDSAAGFWIITAMVCASIAAIMSTTDSVLLSVSSMVVTDVVRPYLLPGRDDRFYVLCSKAVSLGIMAICIALTVPQFQLTALILLQTNILAQALPAFLLGLRFTQLGAAEVLAGMVAGLCVTVGIIFAAPGGSVGGVDAGLFGLGANLAAVAGTHAVLRPRQGGQLGGKPSAPAVGATLRAWFATRTARFPLDRPAYLAFVLLAVPMCMPWYRAPGSPSAAWGGLPSWAFVVILVAIALAVVISVASIWWWDEEDGGESAEASPAVELQGDGATASLLASSRDPLAHA